MATAYGTALGFEGLCWSCRAKHHREEVNNWSLQEIEEKKKQVIEKLKVTEKDKFFSSDEYELFNDLMTRGIDCKEIARVACKREIYYPSELYYKADGEIRDKLIEKLMDGSDSYELVQEDPLTMTAGTYSHPKRGSNYDEQSKEFRERTEQELKFGRSRGDR